MFELRFYQKYILDIIINNNFTYFEIPISLGKTHIMIYYANTLPNKKFLVVSPTIIKSNYDFYKKLDNIEHVTQYKLNDVHISDYDVIIFDNILLDKKQFHKIIDFINSAKKIILLDVKFYDKLNVLNFFKKYNLYINIFTYDKLEHINKMYERLNKIKKIKDKLNNNINI